jgi:hypothetical protein
VHDIRAKEEVLVKVSKGAAQLTEARGRVARDIDRRKSRLLTDVQNFTSTVASFKVGTPEL